MSKSLNSNKNKMKLKEKNTFLKTNYKLRSTGTKFNSIGKIISMNYPFIQNNSDKKQKYKDKNLIKPEEIFSNNKKEKFPISNKININLSKEYNDNQIQNELNKNYHEKKLYGTINHFSINSSPQKEKNSLPKLKISTKEDNNQKKDPYSNKSDMIYSNYFINNKVQKQNNKIINQTHNIFFSKSSEKLNKKMTLQENKSNESFTIKNHNIVDNNKLFNSLEFKPKYFLGKKNKKKENNRMLNSQEIVNDIGNNLLNSKSDTSSNYILSCYGSYSLGGTDAFGRIKTNQDAYLEKEEETLSNNKEYTFGVFDGHGIQGHLVSEAIKNYLQNCSYDQYQTRKKIIAMFSSLSLTIENSNSFDIFCSGSTAVLVHISKEKIICANCGDSRAILINNNNNGNGTTILKLSRDHKPNLSDEKRRILASGGRVDRIYGMGPYRVWFKDGDYPGLAMSRSIGDTLAHKIGVSDLPEIIEYNINNIKPFAIVIASDGVWEFMNNEQVKNIVIKYRNSQDAYICAKEIVEKSRQIWKGTTYAIDDITCVVSFFKKV